MGIRHSFFVLEGSMDKYHHDTPYVRKLIDIASSLTKIADMNFSLYETTGDLVFQSSPENHLLRAIEKTEKGLVDKEIFLNNAIKTTVSRNELTLLRNHAGQYEWYLPIKADGKTLVSRIGSFYGSQNEFDVFIQKYSHIYGITSDEVNEWSKADLIQKLDSLKSKAEQFSLILKNHLASQINREIYEQQFNLIKTIIDITSEFHVGTNESEIIRVMIDFPLMMMNLDTITYAQYNDGQDHFITSLTLGLHSDLVNNIKFPVTGIIEEVITTGDYSFSSDPYDLHRLGIDEDIDCIHIFPLLSEYRILGLLIVFNSKMSKDQIDILRALTKITGFVMDTLKVRKSYDRQISQLSDFYDTAVTLDPQKEEEELYYSIVHNVGKVVNADRVSLMLIEGSDTLQVKAAIGMHRKLASNISVKAGEPIAGQVFESRTPLMIKDVASEYPLNGRTGGTYKTKSFISIPLMINDRAIGVLNIADKISGTIFSEEDFRLLKSFASHASVLIKGSQYYRLSEEMRELSITDSLTEIFNRRYFSERLEEEIQRSERHGSTFALLLADIDNFKKLNDTEGHVCGDSILRSIANITRDSIRAIDIPARFGGEEFAVILPQTDRENANIIAERMRSNIRKYCPRLWNSDPRDAITVSIGLALYPEHGTTAIKLIKSSDKALYRAKMNGKDRVIVFTNFRA
jgi:diguanylate cyclase (GGDEF)-like protein